MVIYKGRRVPDESTCGHVGDLYFNTLNGEIYKLTKVVNPGDNLGFVTVFARERAAQQYIWELATGTGLGDTIILVDKNGVEVVAVRTDEEVDLTADADDIRLGCTAVTDEGIVEGTKEIPAYHTHEGHRIIMPGEAAKHTGNDYDYTKLQAILCTYNTSLSDSVSAEKVVIDNNVYAVQTTEVLANVTVNHTDGAIEFGITNETDAPQILRYFYYKEEL